MGVDCLNTARKLKTVPPMSPEVLQRSFIGETMAKITTEHIMLVNGQVALCEKRLRECPTNSYAVPLYTAMLEMMRELQREVTYRKRNGL